MGVFSPMPRFTAMLRLRTMAPQNWPNWNHWTNWCQKIYFPLKPSFSNDWTHPAPCWSEAQATGSDYAVTLDSREPLLLSNPRLLPAKVFDLSPAASTVDNTLPLQPASVQECFGQDAEDSVERKSRPHQRTLSLRYISGLPPLNRLYRCCSAQSLHQSQLMTTSLGCFPPTSWRIKTKASLLTTSRHRCNRNSCRYPETEPR